MNLWSEKKARQCTDGNIKDQVQKALGKTPLFSERITVIIFTLNERVKTQDAGNFFFLQDFVVVFLFLSGL